VFLPQIRQSNITVAGLLLTLVIIFYVPERK
jgi:hypothetical protein